MGGPLPVRAPARCNRGFSPARPYEHPGTRCARVATPGTFARVRATSRLSATRSARPGRRWDVEVGADLACQSEVDLTVARHCGRALGVEAPEAVVAALPQQSYAVSAQMALEVAALHAPMTSSSGSLSAPSVTSGRPPKRSSRIPRRASITFARASSRARPWL